jgi:hypothetical protein
MLSIEEESDFFEVPIEQDVDLVPLIWLVLVVKVVDPVNFKLLIKSHAKEHGIFQS